MLKQSSFLPLDSTPVGMLVREHISLGQDLTITRFERGANVLRVTLQETGSPEDGALTLVLSDNPLRLDQWVVLDQQHVSTKVTLIDAQVGAKMDPELFVFKDPKIFGDKANDHAN
jgi:outer membrane lipoprotein-sorting protein